MYCWTTTPVYNVLFFNPLRPRQHGRHLADGIVKCIVGNENFWISLKISLKFVLMVRINNIKILVQIKHCRRPDDKPLFEQMMVSFLTHICVSRTHWVKRHALYVDWQPEREALGFFDSHQHNTCMLRPEHVKTLKLATYACSGGLDPQLCWQ